MIEFTHELEPVDPNNLRQNELKSESMTKDDKKYHLDLKVLVCLISSIKKDL
jgi:hypothetical protein